MGIENVYDIMKQLENESSRNTKEQILKANKDNAEFRETLEFLLNPYVVTGISTKKINKKIKIKELVTEPYLIDLKSVISYLKENNSGRDVNIVNIQSFINRQETEELQTFVKKIVTKNLKLGVSEKTVNKIYGKGTIPTFAVMLAETYAKKGDKLKGKFYLTLKLDGNRCVAIKENGITKFFSRKGQEIEGLTQLAKDFNTYPDNQVYDGELLLANPNNIKSDELFRMTQKVIRKDGEKENLEFHMFDSLSISEFKQGKSKRTYEQRRNLIDTFEDTQFIKILPVLYCGEDKNVIPAYSKVVEEKGFEGIMINTANGLYQNKRVIDLLKVKTMQSADLLVMSVEKAIDGQFEGLLSRVNVEYKGCLVGVGSGFTLEQRKQFVENPDLICGKIIEVQFFEESQDEKTGQPSLRFPVFKCIRDDKTIEDIRYY